MDVGFRPVGKCLLNMCKALGLNPSTTKTNQQLLEGCLTIDVHIYSEVVEITATN